MSRSKKALILVVLPFVGCGQNDSAETLCRQMVEVLNELSVALETSESAADAKPKVETLIGGLKDVENRLDAASSPPQDIIQHLEKHVGPEHIQAASRWDKAYVALISKDPTTVPTLGPILTESKYFSRPTVQQVREQAVR